MIVVLLMQMTKQNPQVVVKTLCCLLCALLFSPISANVLAGSADSTVVSSRATAKVHPRQKTYMKREWGIDVLWVRQTAAGYMLEFRYKVLDADKAKALFDRQTKPVLIHEVSGAKMIVPVPAKTGALRNSNTPIAGKTYWMFFANPAKFIKPGDLVSVQIGDYLQQHLTVK